MITYEFISKEDYIEATGIEPLKCANVFAKLLYNSEHVGYIAWAGNNLRVFSVCNFFLLDSYIPKFNEILEATILDILSRSDSHGYKAIVTYRMFNALLKIDSIFLVARPKKSGAFRCTIIRKENR